MKRHRSWTAVALLLGVLSCSDPPSPTQDSDHADASAQWAREISGFERLEPEGKRRLLGEVASRVMAARSVDASLANQSSVEEDVAAVCAGDPATEASCRRIRDLLVTRCRNEYYEPIVKLMPALRADVNERWPGIQMSIAAASPERTEQLLAAAASEIQEHYASRLRDMTPASCAGGQQVAAADPTLEPLLNDIRDRQWLRTMRALIESGEGSHLSAFAGSADEQRALRAVADAMANMPAVTMYRTRSFEVAFANDPGARNTSGRPLADWRSTDVERVAGELRAATRDLAQRHVFEDAAVKAAIEPLFSAGVARADQVAPRPQLAGPAPVVPYWGAAEPTPSIMEQEKAWFDRLSGARDAAGAAVPDGETDPPPHGCDGGAHAYSSHHAGGSGELPLYFMAVYESGPRSNAAVAGRNGEVLVRIERPGPMVLALTAYSQTRWKLSLAPEVELQRIVVSGYEPQTVDGAPEDVPIETIPPSGSVYQWPSVAAAAATRAIENATGARLTDFRGCYRSEWFFIPAREERPKPTPAATSARSFLDKCGEVAKEAAVCLALSRDANVSLMGLVTGAVCTLPIGGGDSSFGDNASLGWIGDKAYFCAREQGVVEVDLSSGAIDVAPLDCGAVTSNGAALYVASQMLDDVVVYASFEDAKAERRQSSWHTAGLQASRFAIRGTRIYAAWHSTDHVVTAELPVASRPQNIPLGGYNGWVLGLDALDDRALAVAVSDDHAGLRIIDIAKGTTIKTLPATTAAGIKCRTVEGFTVDMLAPAAPTASPRS